jgi:hypothetical protein
MIFCQLNGYIFENNIGYISENLYKISDINLSNDVVFENEIIVMLDYFSINDDRYRAIFSSNEIFDLGIQSDTFSSGLDSFNSFEFLHGNRFNHRNEIVISESISIKLFDKTNSVNEVITINGVLFTVSGIIKESNDLMNSIYFISSNLETVLNKDWTFFSFIIFHDDNLSRKLYERGGITLVNRTITKNNQRTINFTANMTIYLTFIFSGVLNLLIKKPKNNNEDEEKIIKEDKNLLNLFIMQIFFITFNLIYLLLAHITLNGINSSIEVGFIYTIDRIPKFYWLLIAYLAPFLLLFYKVINAKIKQKSLEN